jgi:signal transduction histidine kinase
VRITLPFRGEDLCGEIRRDPTGWLLVALPVPAFLSRFATAALLLPGIALFFLVAGALLLWRILTASPDARPSLVPAEATTFRGRLVVVFVLAVLVPLFAVTLFLRGQIAARSERLTLENARSALETARRVLDGYLTGFPPGERVARLGDDVLSFVANSVGYDLSTFSPEADLLATSRRDLYSAGLLPDRVSPRAYSAIGLGGAREQVDSRRLAGAAFRDLTIPLPSLPGAPGIRSPGLLSVLLLPQQRAAEAEASRFFAAVSGFSLLAFLLSAAIAGRVALRVARPVADLVEGTRAVARGDFSPKLAEPPDAELRELVRAFLTMSQSLRDQTEALSREKERLATLLAHLTEGVVAYREDGLVLLANPAAAALGRGDPASLSLAEVFPGSENEPLRRALIEHSGDAVTSRELTLRPGERWRLITVPLPLGGGGARMAVIEDVSDVVRSNRLAAWAEMARIIAHEIKNPLTPIRLSIEHLREVWRRGDRDFGPVLDEAVANVLRQTEELRRSASEFSDYARLPEPSHKDVPVRRLLEDAASAYAAAPGVAWEISAEPGLNARADPRLISRVLSNLLGNSVEALAGRSGRIRLEAKALDGRVEFRVSDNGPGVPAEALPKLFEPYFSAKSGGTGLGLAIARRIVEEHGGAISADNDPRGGLRVTFDLPESGPDADGSGRGA